MFLLNGTPDSQQLKCPTNRICETLRQKCSSFEASSQHLSQPNTGRRTRGDPVGVDVHVTSGYDVYDVLSKSETAEFLFHPDQRTMIPLFQQGVAEIWGIWIPPAPQFPPEQQLVLVILYIYIYYFHTRHPSWIMDLARASIRFLVNSLTFDLAAQSRRSTSHSFVPKSEHGAWEELSFNT